MKAKSLKLEKSFFSISLAIKWFVYPLKMGQNPIQTIKSIPPFLGDDVSKTVTHSFVEL